jgi:hypothetical protein
LPVKTLPEFVKFARANPGLNYASSGTGTIHHLAAEMLRSMIGAQFVQWDILFDTRFRSSPSDSPPVLSPTTPRPQLNFLRLPFRF